jgi:anti-sigma factor RsiW
VAAIEADQTDEPPAAPNLLPSLLFAVRRRRHRSRVMTWSASAAAAAVLAIGVFVGVANHSPTSAPPQASVSALPMAQIGTKALASTVSLSSQNWGTVIDLRCVCLAPVYAHHDKLAMVVVNRDGTHTQLATWVADPGHTATPAGSISTPVGQIAAVQVVSADNGHVLLERSL